MTKKVMICPICGSDEVIFDPKQCLYWCLRCRKEIIPLVTPQEVRNG